MREIHPDWALAYILQDWKKRGRKTVVDAYELASERSNDIIHKNYVKQAIQEARRNLAAYVYALDQVLESWDEQE